MKKIHGDKHMTLPDSDDYGYSYCGVQLYLYKYGTNGYEDGNMSYSVDEITCEKCLRALWKLGVN